MIFEYNENKQIIESFYNKLGLTNEFDKDNIYLERAFNEINEIWLKNFQNIEKVKYLMIAEAPLWGHKKKYILKVSNKSCMCQIKYLSLRC